MFLDPHGPRLTHIALRKELLAAGETDESLARALRTGTFERPRRGAYVDGAQWRTMTAEEQYAVRSRAAYRQANADVAISHTSALALAGAPLWGLDLSDVHLTRLDGRAGRSGAGVRQHCGSVVEGDVIARHDFRTSSPIRATLEVTTFGSVEASLVVAHYFLHRGDYAKKQLEDRYKLSFEQWPGSLTTELVLRLADPRIASVGESRTYTFLWKWHFPRPIPQYEVFEDGGLVAALDFALPDQKVWIEFDGKVKYQELLKPGEDATVVVLREKRREERVAEITGWRCFRITWADLAFPERLAARLQRMIDSMAA